MRDEAIFFPSHSLCRLVFKHFTLLQAATCACVCAESNAYTRTFLYTLESDWVLLYHGTCRSIWLLLQSRCFHTSKHLLYTLYSLCFCPFFSLCEFLSDQQYGSGVMIVFLWVMPLKTDNRNERWWLYHIIARVSNTEPVEKERQKSPTTAKISAWIWLMVCKVGHTGSFRQVTGRHLEVVLSSWYAVVLCSLSSRFNFVWRLFVGALKLFKVQKYATAQDRFRPLEAFPESRLQSRSPL